MKLIEIDWEIPKKEKFHKVIQQIQCCGFHVDLLVRPTSAFVLVKVRDSTVYICLRPDLLHEYEGFKLFSMYFREDENNFMLNANFVVLDNLHRIRDFLFEIFTSSGVDREWVDCQDFRMRIRYPNSLERENIESSINSEIA